MSGEKNTESVIDKAARFIVDKRKALYIVFLAAVLFCGVSISKVQINNDITTYLPPETETRRGLTLMDKEFVTLGSAQIMVSNLTYAAAQSLAEQIEAIDGVDSVAFDGSADHYQNAAALFSVSFSDPETSPEAEAAMRKVTAVLDGYDVYVSSAVGSDYNTVLQQEMRVILLVAAAVIFVVLLFTSKSYLEIPVFLIVFVVSAVLNMGTNYWFGEISFVTNSIAVVLQLALAIDYAIIFCHRYMEERDNGLEAREADIAALSKAIVEISSSSLTTISGLVALMLMQFRIGFDMGVVLSKGIICSMLSVFLLMPGLLMLFNKGIERTRHKTFVPRITLWGKAVVKTRYILPVLFGVAIAASLFCSNQCDYVFSTNSVDTRHPSVQRIAQDKISGAFGQSTTIAVLVPKGDYDSEGAILRQVERFPQVASATGLANIEVEDGLYLTDKLNPRRFAELAGVDIELARLLFQAYGLSVEEYGAIFQSADSYEAPLLDVFRFLCEQKDRGVVTLTGEQAEQVEELQETLEAGLEQLEGENWSRLVFTAKVPEEGEETDALLEEIRAAAAVYYGDDVILVGNATSARDLRDSFTGDNLKISALTALFVMIILLFTFQSAGLPILLILTIQGAIWINFSFPFLTGTNLFFMAYLIVSAIQMGATIDYAIVITNRYLELKKILPYRDAVVESLTQSFPTVFTSGSIMTVAGFLIGEMTTDPTIGSIGQALGRGTLISILLVMTVLPQLLLLGDVLIERTALTLNRDRKQRFNRGAMRLDGHVRGHIAGFVDGEFKGVIHGSVDALIESKYQELEVDGDEAE